MCDSHYLSIRSQRAQEALQVAMGHQLHHNQGGLAFRHNAQQTHLRDKYGGGFISIKSGLMAL